MAEFKIYSKRLLFLIGLIIGIAVTLIMLIFSNKGAFDFLEQKSLDWRFQVRGEIEANPKIVIVAIDEASFSELDQKWPWPRTYFARLIDLLSQEGTEIIGIDIIMSESFPGDQDEQLARSAKSFGKVVFSGKFEEMVTRPQLRGKEVEIREEVFKGPIKTIYESGDVGYVNLPQDSDGFVRRFTPIRSYHGQSYASFILRVAALYLGVPLSELKYVPYNVLHLGDCSIPLNDYDSAYINFAGPSGKFQRISFHQVLSGQYPAGFFEGKIVLVGATFLDSHDSFATPFMRSERMKRYPLFGVEILANIVNTILQKRFIKPSSTVLDWLIIILGGVLMTLLSLKLSPLKGVILVALIVLLYLLTSMWLFTKHILLTTTAPVVTIGGVFLSQVVFRYFTEEREKRRIRGVFQKYVSPDVVDKLMQDPRTVKLGGEEKFLSVLFCDLVDFTTYSERFPPQEMVAILSEFFKEMTDQVFAYQGTLKEYVGDELMAFFGAPIKQADHAERACAAALAMQERLLAMRRVWLDMGRPALRTRIGINSGPMLVGNLGSAHRFSYGVLGDQVNLGSRLQGLNKLYGTEIMIGENTARLVMGSFLLREVDSVRVQGRKQPVRIYELVARLGASSPKQREQAFASYAAGLEDYRQQCWEAALSHFEQARALWPEDRPSRVMAGRCRIYQEVPPQEGWDGVFRERRK
jgi:adenylate cyclase